MINNNDKKGLIFVVAAASGVGKTTLVNALIQSDKNIRVSVSHTTRAKRPDEIADQHYHFVSVDEFKAIQNKNGFIEHAKVYQNYYGTSREAIERPILKGHDVILDIDWQGAEQVRTIYGMQTVSIFLLPPSIDVLRQRLLRRGQDSASVIEMRMQQAQEEIRHYSEFDYLIINDDFSAALDQLKAIVTSARLRTGYQEQNHAQFLQTLTHA